MTSPSPLRSNSAQPTQQPWDPTKLHAENPGEFAALLRYILNASGLTAGQVAVKAKIPRSQAYSLIKPGRTTLPAKQEQVVDFVTACGVTEMQRDVVLSIYQQLQREQQERLDRKEAANAVLASNEDAGAETVSRLTLLDEVEPARPAKMWARQMGFYEFLRYVLISETRVRRLLWLLYPLVALVLGAFVLIGVIVWANPSLGPQVLTGIGVAGVISAMPILVRRRR